MTKEEKATAYAHAHTQTNFSYGRVKSNSGFRVGKVAR